MSVRNTKDGSNKPWLCECYPQGREGKRVRKRFCTKGEANSFELHTLKNVDDKPWVKKVSDNRQLSELLKLWYDLHGSQLANEQSRLSRVKNICHGLGNPIAQKLSVNDFAKYRQMRLNGEIEDLKGNRIKVKAVTVNHDRLLLNAVYSTLFKLGEISYESPISDIKDFKIKDNELSFLYPAEIPELLTACRNSSYEYLELIVKICLSTGCRWGEAESMTRRQVIDNKITFTKTKNGKSRTIPISPELANEIPKVHGKLFKASRELFSKTLKKTSIKLPEGQATHVLRHTFATHFMINGGNILVLKEILGHSKIEMTMKYAHFAPAHLEDAVTKNPLANL